MKANMRRIWIFGLWPDKEKVMRLLMRTAVIALPAGLLMSALPVYADAEHSDVASGAATVAAEEVEDYGMLPVYGRDIEDGTYEINVRSSSRFFRVLSAELTVDGDDMEARLTLSSGSYLLLYMGTGEEAAAAPFEDYLTVEKDDGWHFVTVPVKALNTGIDCAAYSKRKKKWYNRQILFDAASLPKEVLQVELPDYELIGEALGVYAEQSGIDPEELTGKKDAEEAGNTAGTPVEGESEESLFSGPEGMEIDLPDGEYSIEVTLVGGSGRASVSSPTLLIVKDGRAYARLLWSSSYYDYMFVGGEKYLNEAQEGASASFTIPVYVMDTEMPVIADSTAMGDPVAVDYDLTFYRDSIGEKGRIPQEAARSVLIVAVIVIVGGFLLDRLIRWIRKRSV